MTQPVSDRLARRPGSGPHHRTGRALHLTACGTVIQPNWERGDATQWADENGCRRCFPATSPANSLPTATEALREAVVALRESREYIRAEAPHGPTDTELARVLTLCQAALRKTARTP